ncbi:MAG: VCBS repeat-containing protein [Bacteroidetes bacterium]|nr:VCBS repeat-containing protein [Bacteroidota bacterium]
MPGSSPDLTDTAALRQSAWFSVVSSEITRELYHFHPGASASIRGSDNRSQSLVATYAPDRMLLKPVQPVAEGQTPAAPWSLDLRLQQIAFDGRQKYLPSASATVQQKDSSLVYDHQGDFKVEYINTEAGIRQNFIVNRAPARNAHNLAVRLVVTSALAARSVPGGKEIHFTRPAAKKATALTTELAYSDLKAWDATGRELSADMQAMQNGKEIVINVSAENAVYPVTIDPLSTSAATTLSGTGTENFGFSVCAAGDINHDGYSDVIVGAASANKAYVYYGSASGLSTTKAWTGSQASGGFGSSVATAGDLNGDGYSDVVIGAPADNKAYVYYSSASGLPASASLTLSQTSGSFGTSVALAGDVNGDGFSDIIIGASGTYTAYGYYGSDAGITSTTASWSVTGTSTSLLGTSVAAAGDVNGDGYSDVIIGASGTNKAYVYLGSSTGLATSVNWSSPTGSGNYGSSVSSAGDVNGDGYSDVLIGAPGANKSYIYYGTSAGITSTGASTLTGSSNFGVSVACAGDVNGDGYSDVIVGASSINTAYVYFGASGGITTTAAWTGTGSGSYGNSVAPAGDINGDGFSDVIVGNKSINSNKGAAYIFTGSAAATLTSTSWTKNGSGGQTGFRVSSAGDVNGDGYSDLLVGVSGVPGPLGGPAYAGAAYVYHGSATGLSSTAAWSQTGAANSNFGSVATAGDVNGDGYSDVIVGATGAGSTNTGAAYVYFGSSTGLSTTVSWTGTGAASGSYYGYSVACAGDVNADGYSDILVGTYALGTNNGAAYLYLGSAAGPATSASWTGSGAASSYYGACVAGAGDVNGDGYSDILIGAPGVGANYNGAVYLYKGSAAGITGTTAAWSKTGASYSVLGIGAASAGDVNGDGYGDVIVGGSGIPTGGAPGYAAVYLGSASGLAASPVWSVTTGNNTYYGWSVASAGDVNGDGYSEIIVGAYGSGSNNNGAAYMYYGSASGPSATASWTVTGSNNSYYGGSVASAGDVNGDGYSDVVTAPYGKASSPATISVYNGNANASNNAGTLQLWNANLTSPLSASNKFAKTFGISMRPVSFIGRTDARLAWDVEKNGMPFSYSSTVAASVDTNGAQPAMTDVSGGLTATAIKATVKKSNGLQFKIRARMQYSMATAITGQLYGPWKYSAQYMAGNQSQMALPIQLGNFSGLLSTQGRVLNWWTATETGGSHFELQRSADARSFTPIATIAAAAGDYGNSYSYTDREAVSGSIVYYRLKSVNIDGSAAYSSVVAIRLGTSEGNRLQLVNSLVSAQAFVQYRADNNGVLDLNVISMAGQPMLHQSVGVSSGANSFTINAAALPKGYYLLQARQKDGATQTVRFLRQ